MKNNKVLILTYYWPPAGGAGVQRWLKFAKYLVQLGYEPHIYTAENPEAPALDKGLLDDIPPQVKVIKKTIWEPFGFYKNITGKKGSFNAGFLTEEKQNKRKWTERFALFIRANIFIPDAKMFWIKPSARFLKKYMVQENIDLVISSGPPHSMHLIALQLKKNLPIKWVADFRDPWTNIDFYQTLPITTWADKKQHALEKKVLETADRIIVVGEEMKKEFKTIHHQAKINVITNGFDGEISTNTVLDKKFTIAHIGMLNADRCHRSFYAAIATLLKTEREFEKHLELKFIGKLDIKARELLLEYKLLEYATITSYIPYQQIAAIQQSAHILYLPINNTPNTKGILTGKFFEYLAAKRPIIAQGSTEGDIAKILTETNAGAIFDFEDKENLQIEIRNQFVKFQSGVQDFSSKDISKYSRKNLTQQLDMLLQDVRASWSFNQ